jgi:hypothetical protein
VTALTRFFFDAVYAPRSAWSVVGWWERRRSTYNLVVGAAGLVTLTAVNLFSLLFAVGLTLLPIPLVAMGWVFRLLGLFG